MKRLCGLALALMTGCTGAIDSMPSAPTDGTARSPAKAPEAPTGEVTKPGPQEPASMGPVTVARTCSAAPALAPTPVRRLSRTEYDNTVRDLLGISARPAAAFPVDEAASGFASNTVSPPTRLLTERYMEAAEALAAEADLTKLLPCTPMGAGEEPCARQFMERFGHRAFRRPLSSQELDRLFALWKAKRARSEFAGATRLVIAALLQAPSFLYRPEAEMPVAPGTRLAPLGAHELATRLSYLVWASMPDDRLLSLAETGALARPETLEAEARRLLGDARAAHAIHSFYRQLLHVDHLDGVTKDERLFPAFTTSLKAAMAEEPARFAEHLHREGDRSMATLLTAGHSFVDSSLARLYGVPAPGGNGFARVDLPKGQRSGVLTQAGPLAALSFPDQESPIHRGHFVRTSLFCQTVPEPPQEADIVPPRVDPNVSAKQRFEQHRKDPACRGCHQLMDPIGFGFSHYDAIGRWKAMDGKAPVDATGELASTDVDGPFTGALELGQRLSGSREVQRCFVRQWLRFGLGRADLAQEGCFVDAITDRFVAARLDLRELVVAVVMSDMFRQRPVN